MTADRGGVFIVSKLFKGGKLSIITVSGVVTVDGSVASRTVIAYNTLTPEKPYETISDEITGEFSLVVRAGPNEKVRVICVGETGENSQIYEHLPHADV